MLNSIKDEQNADVSNGEAPSAQNATKKSPFLRSGRVVVQTLLMLAVLVGSYAAMNRLIDTRAVREPRPVRPTIYTVETLPAQPQDNRPALQVYGEVQAARSVELRPLVNGEIITVNADLKAGSPLTKGDVLLEIDPFNYRGALSEAKANLAKAQASLTEIEARIVAEKEQLLGAQTQLKLAQSDLQRAQSLVSSGNLTEKQVEDRRLIVSQREQSVSQSRNNQLIAQAQREQQVANIDSLSWKVEQAERNLENTVLRSPFSGVVNSANAEPGRYVSSADVVATIYDDKAMEVRLTLTDAQYGRISTDADPLIGRSTKVVWVVGLSSYEYAGHIDRIAAEIASSRGGVELVALIDPTSAAVQLRPGAFVEVVVPDRLYPDSYRLPETALYNGADVFVVQEGKLARRTVKVAAFDGEDIIVADGLQPGDQVMTTHLTQADEGVVVRQPGDAVAGTDGKPGKMAPASAGGS